MAILPVVVTAGALFYILLMFVFDRARLDHLLPLVTNWAKPLSLQRAVE